MTRIFEDPAEFTSDAVNGFVNLYGDLVRQIGRASCRERVLVVV